MSTPKQDFINHVQAELDKLPQPKPLNERAMYYARQLQDYIEHADDIGDMDYILFARCWDEAFQAGAASAMRTVVKMAAKKRRTR